MGDPANPLFPHEDALSTLGRGVPLEDKIAAIHLALFARHDFIDRISITAYDQATDMLRTFVASSPGRNSLVRYEAKLADSRSLQEILKVGRARVVNDLAIFAKGTHLHTNVIAEEGWKSSYTAPMFLNGTFWGFIFFNSVSVAPFTDAVLPDLELFSHLISTVVTSEMLAVRILAAAVKTAHDMVHYRDPETGNHIDRMSRYSRLIAQHLAATGAAKIDDATIERIFQFAPLHDLGKIGIPDRILLKQGALTPEEREEMKTHTTRGLAMIEAIAHNFGLEHLDGLDLLRHIAEAHHETLDGTGYPRGLRDGQIPLEARIVAVADVFDALTSRRSYKPAWSNEEAFAWLRKLSRTQLDASCVEALIFNSDNVSEIQRQFRDVEEVK